MTVWMILSLTAIWLLLSIEPNDAADDAAREPRERPR
jgi:hypothetical protein